LAVVAARNGAVSTGTPQQIAPTASGAPDRTYVGFGENAADDSVPYTASRTRNWTSLREIGSPRATSVENNCITVLPSGWTKPAQVRVVQKIYDRSQRRFGFGRVPVYGKIVATPTPQDEVKSEIPEAALMSTQN
jgi:hypothetical protein